MIIFVYVTVALGVIGITVWAISLLGKKAKKGWWIGWIVIPAFSTLFMIKLRCMTEAYPCGFMSFRGGFTWHLLLGFVVFVAMWALSGAVLNCVYPRNWADWMSILGRSMIPLVGFAKALSNQEKIVRDTAAKVFKEKNDSVEYLVELCHHARAHGVRRLVSAHYTKVVIDLDI